MMTTKPIQTYKDLQAWQHARTLVREVYRLTDSFPKDEVFGLRQQLRRAVISVPSNIAEGYGRQSRDDYLRFLKIARGSLYETETQLILAADLDYISHQQLEKTMNVYKHSISLLQGLIRNLAATPG